MCREQTPWEKAVDFHGHSCPGLAIGYRAAWEALERLDTGPARDEEMVAIVETDACGVDAVQFLTSCTFGKGNLIYRDYGKQAFTFGVRGKKEGVRLAVKYGALDKYAPEEWKALREKAARQEATEEEREKIRAYQAEMIDLLLHERVEEIFDIQQVEVDLPPKARLFDSLQCAFCGEGVMEPRARVKEGKFACSSCFEGYPSRISK